MHPQKDESGQFLEKAKLLINIVHLSSHDNKYVANEINNKKFRINKKNVAPILLTPLTCSDVYAPAFTCNGIGKHFSTLPCCSKTV